MIMIPVKIATPTIAAAAIPMIPAVLTPESGAGVALAFAPKSVVLVLPDT